MYMIAFVIFMVITIVLWWQIKQLVIGYRAATGTPLQRFLAVFSHSMTILLARLTTAFGVVSAFVASLLPQLDPTTSLGQAVVGLFTAETAKYWLTGIGVLGLLFEFARRRSGSVDPILPPPQANVVMLPDDAPVQK